MIIDDFLIRALLAGVGIAVIAGPLGCFVVWRRMAYFGDTIAHGALLGVAFGVAFGAPPLAGVLAFILCLSLGLSAVLRSRLLGIDSWLGMASHGALALGLVAVSVLGTRIDLLALLLGDVLAVSWGDVGLVYAVALALLAALAIFWSPLLKITVDPDLARAEGVNVTAQTLFLMLSIGLVIGIAMKITGVLLVTALLVIPAVAARLLSRSPEDMAIFAVAIGVCSVCLGLGGSFLADIPAGPAIIAAALALFGPVAGITALSGWIKRKKR